MFWRRIFCADVIVSTEILCLTFVPVVKGLVTVTRNSRVAVCRTRLCRVLRGIHVRI